MSLTMHVRRASRDDLTPIAELYNRCRPHDSPRDARDILISLAETGYLVAQEDGSICAFIAWRAENLIARVIDACIEGDGGGQAARHLLESLHEQARELHCEASFLNGDGLPAQLAEAARDLGYETVGDRTLPLAWKEAAAELGAGQDALLVTLLSDQRVRGPL